MNTPVDPIQRRDVTEVTESCLRLPTPAIAFHAGRRLRELFPDRFVMECTPCGFDLTGFVEAGQAQMIPWSESGHQQIVTSWRGCKVEPFEGVCVTGESGLRADVTNGFAKIVWREESLDALQLTWRLDMQVERVAFLLASSRTQAESFYTAVCEWSSLPHGEVLVFEGGTWNKDRDLFQSIRGSTFASLVLAPGLAAELRRDVAEFFAARETYARFGIPWKRGVLLVGPPGNGKTHAIKALCHELGRPALYVRSLQPQHRFQTGEHGNIAAIFSTARRSAPCLLVFEDIESLITSENRSFFLNELDGFADNHGLCVLATTNYPERLDPAILERPSRFDRKYHFNLPGPSERLAYLAAWNQRQKAELQLTAAGLSSLAAETHEFSFAYLKELCLSATMAWINRGTGADMDSVAAGQAALLRAQMTTPKPPTAEG